MRRPTLSPLDARVTPAALTALADMWPDQGRKWLWQCPFVTPPWLSAWWQCFGGDDAALLLQVSLGGRPAGLAPLMIQGDTARFMGSPDLCDYFDFPAAADSREAFFQALLHYLAGEGVRQLVLGPVRPDSAVIRGLLPVARSSGCRVSISEAGASLQMGLPASWDGYLSTLSGKQRHEVRRKLRRAADAGIIETRIVRDAAETAAAMDVFLQLFRQSRADKAAFMTSRREAFFRMLADGLARADMLNLVCVDIGGRPAAAAFCFDLGQTTYLYNNGFDPRYLGISIGLISKLATIRASIEHGRQVYDFLNGTERYKYQLGGSEVPLSTCVVEL